MLRTREARFEDARSIAAVHVDTWRTTYAGIVPDDALAALSYAWKDIRQLLGPEQPD